MTVRIPTASLKFIIGWTAVLLFRLIPWRPPNIEPLMATLMPFSKRFGVLGSFTFAFLGIVLYDAITSGWGIWTWITAFAYGAVAIAAVLYFKHREATVANFLFFGVPATILYDALTMMIGPLFQGQSFAVALVGQIPFTAMHLLGTIAFASILSPVIYQWVVENDALEFASLTRRIS